MYNEVVLWLDCKKIETSVLNDNVPQLYSKLGMEMGKHIF